MFFQQYPGGPSMGSNNPPHATRCLAEGRHADRPHQHRSFVAGTRRTYRRHNDIELLGFGIGLHSPVFNISMMQFNIGMARTRSMTTPTPDVHLQRRLINRRRFAPALSPPHRTPRWRCTNFLVVSTTMLTHSPVVFFDAFGLPIHPPIDSRTASGSMSSNSLAFQCRRIANIKIRLRRPQDSQKGPVPLGT